MPVYNFVCPTCGKVREVFRHTMNTEPPECCGGVMNRHYISEVGGLVVKMGPPGWCFRMDEIHKAQADRGERLRMVHPKEIGATG